MTSDAGRGDAKGDSVLSSWSRSAGPRRSDEAIDARWARGSAAFSPSSRPPEDARSRALPVAATRSATSSGGGLLLPRVRRTIDRHC